MNNDCNKKTYKTSIGGQAVIEGVMMKGPENIAVAVRKSDGEIVTENMNMNLKIRKSRFFKLPVVRGVVAFVDSLVLGTKTLMYSAELYDVEDEEEKQKYEPSKLDKFIEKVFGNKEAVIYFAVFIAILLSMGLFIWLPAVLVSFLRKFTSQSIILSLIEGAVRMTIFVIYIALVSKNKDIQRVFEYHGAEHKTIFCYENQEELTIENVKKYSRLHPRCGTSFLLEVMIISVIVFSFISWSNLFLRIFLKLLLMPVVAGLAYEFLKFAGRSESKIIKVLNKPGLWMQNLTTREPDDKEIEVAIAALTAVTTGNREDDKW